MAPASPTSSDRQPCSSRARTSRLGSGSTAGAGLGPCPQLWQLLLPCASAGGMGGWFSPAFLGIRRKAASSLAAALALPCRAEQLSPKAGADHEHTATMEHHNKQGPRVRESKRQVFKGLRGAEHAAQDLETSCLCAPGPGKGRGHLILIVGTHTVTSPQTLPSMQGSKGWAPGRGSPPACPPEGNSARRLLGWVFPG